MIAYQRGRYQTQFLDAKDLPTHLRCRKYHFQSYFCTSQIDDFTTFLLQEFKVVVIWGKTTVDRS
ncbi:hypothetical protein DPMN_051430 [Dreissena polymorpha]|uniref:Uncharacterized protein n=1 Tax=Dreissena polymorpha TaxID=45954 RepID=A0A9D4CHU2_DREPO|nr:hypothetical protein DPMN_051430 [Dreissena polymorpha]